MSIDQNLEHSDNRTSIVLSRKSFRSIPSSTSFLIFLSIAGAIRWLAPELCFDPPQRSSPSSDVWAYGCVILEITTNDLPWAQKYHRHSSLMKDLADKKNAIVFQEIARDQEAPKKLINILCACCTWSKHNRPNFVEIIQSFHTVSDTDRESSKEPRMTMRSSRTHRDRSQTDTSNHYRNGSSAHVRGSKSAPRIQSLYSTDEDEDYSPSAGSQRYENSQSRPTSSGQSTLWDRTPTDTRVSHRKQEENDDYY